VRQSLMPQYGLVRIPLGVAIDVKKDQQVAAPMLGPGTVAAACAENGGAAFVYGAAAGIAEYVEHLVQGLASALVFKLLVQCGSGDAGDNGEDGQHNQEFGQTKAVRFLFHF